MASGNDPFADTSPLAPRRTGGFLQRIMTYHSRTASAKDETPTRKKDKPHGRSTDDLCSRADDDGEVAFGKTHSQGTFPHHAGGGGGGSKLLRRFKNILTSSHGGLTPTAEEDARHEPCLDGSFNHMTETDACGHPNVKIESTEIVTMEDGNEMEDGAEAYYYYTTETGEVYYIDASQVEYQPEVEDVEEEQADKEDEGNNEKKEGEDRKEGEGEQDDAIMSLLEEEHHDGGVSEEQTKKELVLLKGKAAKALLSEETKARKLLQEDCMIVLMDIGRTYRGMARSVAPPTKCLKAFRQTVKHMEKDATKGTSAIEANWRNEIVELNRMFRAELEVLKKRDGKKAERSLYT